MSDSKKVRRGNHLLGGIAILFGTFALLFGLSGGSAIGWTQDKKRPANVTGVICSLLGGVILIPSGIMVWRGTLMKE